VWPNGLRKSIEGMMSGQAVQWDYVGMHDHKLARMRCNIT